ncbi:MAG: acylneuraminate cytidylyltransferase family protein [Sporolactobacillus sp.]
MYNNRSILAIIPARGGSRGIPHKNIVDICGLPLIAYSINEAKKSKYIDTLVVSTEDDEIAHIAEQFGAEVPFKRPAALAKDETPGMDPILHAIKWFKEKNIIYNDIMCLQCTTPLRTAKQIDEAIEKHINTNADALVSVCESKISPYWMKKIENGNLVDFVADSPFYARRQETPVIYQLNGAIYLAKAITLLKNKTWYTPRTLAYVMDEQSSLDIDSSLDLKFFEYLEREKHSGKV